VAFPSEAQVRRDIVFSKFASVGGVKESWTAACFILTAEFADELPHDEDQMPLNGNPHPMPGLLQPNLNNFVNPQFPEIGWDVQEQVQPHDNHGVQHPLWEPEEEEEQDQVMEVEVQVQEQQQVVIPEQPMEQEVHQFNESAFIDTSSSEGSVNMIPATQNLVINRIEMQFEVLGKDLISFLDKQFPNYKTCMHNVMVGPLLPKDMVMDRIHKNLTPVLFMQAIPLAVPASSFAWISKLPSFCGKSMVPFDNVEDSVVPESVIGREVVSRRSNIVPLTPRVTIKKCT
jgi:hypothetical protein